MDMCLVMFFLAALDARMSVCYTPDYGSHETINKWSLWFKVSEFSTFLLSLRGKYC